MEGVLTDRGESGRDTVLQKGESLDFRAPEIGLRTTTTSSAKVTHAPIICFKHQNND